MLKIRLKDTRLYREIKEEGREAMAHAIARLLTKRLGELLQRNPFFGFRVAVAGSGNVG